jgi:hypothetical protein
MGFSRGDVVVDQRVSPLFGERDRRGSAALPSAVEVLRGAEAIVQKRNLLRELCLRTGQTVAVENLDVWLDTPTERVKIPYLVLVGARDPMQRGGLSAADLDGAVLIFEYRIAGRGTGVLATGDVNGDQAVFAPVAIRAEIAEIAARTLVEQGATVALISLPGDLPPGRQSYAQAAVACRIATRQRVVPRYLPLATTLDETLATLGNHTRRNFRYYRRRVERDFRVEFVAEAALDLEQFLAINRESTYPFSHEMAVWRYQSLSRLHIPVFCGLRSESGQWLSLIAGHRQPAALVVDWQINLAGLPRYSLSTVMRSFLMEYEIARGTRKLFFEGGTPHSMRHSFASTPVADVLVERRSAKAWMLRHFSGWIFPRKNFLGQTWRDPSLDWIDC